MKSLIKCQNTSSMRGQYPTCPASRKTLARYLVNDLRINPFEGLLSTLRGQHAPTVANGIISVGDLSFPESLVAESPPDVLQDVAFVSLVIHCIGLVATPPIMAQFVLSEHLKQPSCSLCAKLWEQLAFMHVAPQPVCSALLCARPDMIECAKHLYGKWLLFCRSPHHIAGVLNEVVESAWHIKSGTPVADIMISTVKTLQVATRQVKQLKNADIIVDDRAGLIVSNRDKSFMALLFLAGPDRERMQSISAFKDAKESFPQAFQQLECGLHPLDELQITTFE